MAPQQVAPQQACDNNNINNYNNNISNNFVTQISELYDSVTLQILFLEFLHKVGESENCCKLG